MTNIEQKTQNEDIQKVPSKFSGNCPVCKTDAVFNYRGLQKSRIAKPIAVYICGNCTDIFRLDKLINDYHATFKESDLINSSDFKEPQSIQEVKAAIQEIYHPSK